MMTNADKFKLVLFICLTAGSCTFVLLFRHAYNTFMAEGAKAAEVDPVEKLGTKAKVSNPAALYPRMMVYGAFFFCSAIGIGLMTGREVSRYIAERFYTVLYDADGELAKTPEYELAEQEWMNGNPLDAIQMMRNYLKTHPYEQHVALRIAEIYEKDLRNYLAAALEYEEVLKHKLQDEQWGWSAIHLCNLYSTKLNQPDRSLALLKRIETEYGHTAAAEKARKHLGVEEPEEVAPPPPAFTPPPKSQYPASDRIND